MSYPLNVLPEYAIRIRSDRIWEWSNGYVEVKEWIEQNHLDLNYIHNGVFVFRDKESAMRFKLVWG